MNLQTSFYLKHLILDETMRPTEVIAYRDVNQRLYYVNNQPVLGYVNKKYELYQDLEYLTYRELLPFFKVTQDFLYQAVRLIGDVSVDLKSRNNVYRSVEKVFDETIIHLVAENVDQIAMDDELRQVRIKYDYYLIGSIHQSIESVLLEKLYEQNLHISFAESCTGGMLVSRLINAYGASEVISRSYVTYGVDAKNEILGVDLKLIKKYGVVSSEVAEAMVSGLARISKAEVNVSVTGYAGGEEPAPDDGLCYFAIDYDGHLDVERHVFKGSRNEVRQRMSSYILWRIGQILSRKH